MKVSTLFEPLIDQCYKVVSHEWDVFQRVIPCSPTPASPTPILPTLDQKVAFRLLMKKKLAFGHQNDVKASK